MALWKRETPEDQWKKVLEAVQLDDSKALSTALKAYRKAVPETSIFTGSLTSNNVAHGNSASLALHLLKGKEFTMSSLLFKKTLSNTRERMKVVDLLVADWLQHGAFKQYSGSGIYSEPLDKFISSIIARGDVEGVRKAMALFPKAPKLLESPDGHADWIYAVLKIPNEEQSLACIEILNSIGIKPVPLFTALQSIFDAASISDIPTPVRPKALESLLRECRYGTEDPGVHSAIKHYIAEKMPLKSLLDAVGCDGSEEGMAAAVVQHVRQTSPPDLLGFNSDPEFPSLWEDRRRGILSLYAAARDAGDPHVAEKDESILKTVAMGLKKRLASGRGGVKEEMEFYAAAGLLSAVYETAGVSTGFADNNEYLAALRERIIPDYFAEPEKRGAAMRTGDWAAYRRDMETEREGSALAAYARG